MKFIGILLFLALPFLIFANDSKGKKTTTAKRTDQEIIIDANLDEQAWQTAEVATGFTQMRPNPGKSASFNTEVKIIYDNEAIYVGAKMYDPAPDSILQELGLRDNFNNTDFFGIVFDTYLDEINGFGFFVTPSGVQMDAKYSSFGEDNEWDAVWESKVAITENGWVAEYKIPYSAIRFPKKDVQKWGVNMVRLIRRYREQSFWSELDPKANGLLTQSGILTGIENIEAPLRLSFTPYVSFYLQNYPYNVPERKNTSTSINGGMDLKYGINESFTLDMTLIPDFGQVVSDNEVLNLSPFEVFYNENRSFFTEGTELFSKGDLFYSRRVGGRPVNYFGVQNELLEGEIILENPSESQLYNATKISGRTSGGLGIGFFNATTATTYATVIDTFSDITRKVLTAPVTNYNVLVFDQSLKNNSYLTFINTNVMRDGAFYDANVTGTTFSIQNKSNKYSIWGGGYLSQKYHDGFDSVDLGYRYKIAAGKVSGNFKFELVHSILSDNYDINDLGFLTRNNTIEYGFGTRYNIYEPFWILNEWAVSSYISYIRIYDPNAYYNFGINLESWGTFKNFTSAGIFSYFEPVLTYDWFEPRVAGRFYTYPVNFNIGGWISTDYRKKFALDINGNFRPFDDLDRYYTNLTLSPRMRVNDKLSFIYSFNFHYRHQDVGYANITDAEDIIFGRREVESITNTLTGNYLFNNKMALGLKLRHYWSKADYTSYYLLQEDGYLGKTDYTGDHDINFNAFNVDLIYTWQFAPGSELSLVWKNAILDFTEGKVIDNYFTNVKHTLDADQLNSLSLKILYYLDYQEIKSTLKKRI